MHSFAIERSTAKMRYLELEGSGIPLLILHGLGCASSFEYPHVVSAPALRGRHAILLDLLGFGFSDRPEDFGYRVEDHARQVHGLIRERNFQQIDIYGHSMGGSIAIEAADLLGDKVQNLVVSEANLDRGGGMFSRAIAAWKEVDYMRTGHSAMLIQAQASGNGAWAAMMRAASARAVHRGAASLVEGGSRDWRSQFLQHPSQKTFIFGKRSLPDPDFEFLSSRGIRVDIVDDAGHSMAIENPGGLAAAIAQATMTA